MNELKLYNYFRSSTSYRVRIAMHLKNLNFEYIPVHLLNNGGEQHSVEYKKISPLGEVPTLVHNGKAIAQSVAIIEYLDEIFPQPQLYPQDAFHKARVRQICENINSFMHPLANLKVQQYLEKKHGYTQTDKEAWVQHWVSQGFAALEDMLSITSGRYAYGQEVTAADVFIVPMVFSAQRFKVDLSKYPNVMRVNDEALKLDGFAKAHPSKQIDFFP